MGLPYHRLACTPQGAKQSGSGCGIRLPFWSFVYIGVAQLICWNSILTCMSFLHDEVFTGTDWAFTSAILYSACLTCGAAVMLRGGLSTLPFGAHWYLSILACVASLLALLAMVVLSQWDRVSVETGYTVALSCMVVLGFGSAVFQSITYGLAGACDPRLSAKLMVGSGFAGLATGAASLLPPSLGTFGSLTLAAVATMLLTLVLFSSLLRKDEYIKPILERLELNRVSPPSTPVRPEDRGLLPLLEAPQQLRPGQIARHVAPQATATFLVFTITFLVFPGIVSEWQGAFGLSSTQFVQLLVGEFQVFDVVGRIAASWVPLPSPRVVLELSLARLVFVPLFVGAQMLEGSFLDGGIWKALIMGAFAISNGFVSTLGMMLGPKGLKCSEERMIAGNTMSLSLVAGITTGSFLALMARLWQAAEDWPHFLV